jgi:hypothetical protein
MVLPSLNHSRLATALRSPALLRASVGTRVSVQPRRRERASPFGLLLRIVEELASEILPILVHKNYRDTRNRSR